MELNSIPSVSIIVPNYNHASFLQQRIESILSQSFQDYELIVLDDCSTDNSCEIIESFRGNPKVSQIVYNETNSGSAFCQWNKGIALAKGKWIWIAESDDWAEPDFLAVMLMEAELHPECGLIFSLPKYVYPDGSSWNDNADGNTVVYHGGDFASYRLLYHNAIHNVSSILMRRSVLQQADLSSCAAMHLCGDWLLYCQLCTVSNILEVRRTLCYYRIHTTNVSTRAELNGLPLIEGIEVLNYLVHTFNIPAKAYSRLWGRTWAKLERQHHYGHALREMIQRKFRPYPFIRFWHRLYQLRLCLK